MHSADNINMNRDFFSAEEAQLLLERFREGIATPEEEALVEKWFAHLAATGNSSVEVPQMEAMSEAMRSAIFSAIVPEATKAATVPIWRKKGLKYAAAALFFVASAATYFILTSQKRELKTITEYPANLHDIEPGGNIVILTLGDGSSVILDSVANGLITQQGNTTITKLRDGSISYVETNKDPAKALINTMTTPRGGQYQLTLPDNTKVWLNASSSISFPTHFGGTDRRVTISGEIYFEVAENKNQPFIVQINNQASIEVLGTRFNVKCYNDEPNIKATLVEGAVRVWNNSKTIVLTPGQQAVVEADDIAIIKNADIDHTLAWKHGFFNFKKADIQRVMLELSRWYNIEVTFQGAIPVRKFSGEMDRGLTLRQVLKILKQSDVNYTLEGNRLIIRP